MKKLIISLILVLPFSVMAAGGGNVHLESANVNLKDKLSLQRGAQIFVNNCQGCHGVKYIRYSRLVEGLGLTEDQVAENLMFTGEKLGDQMVTAMNADDAKQWFGVAPPDLTLVAKVRSPDWIYSYLTSWEEDESRPFGYNNSVFPNVGMPNVLADMEASMSEEEFETAMRDVANFLAWTSDPEKLDRERIGAWALFFLVFIMLPVIWLLNAEYWKDID